jgi:LCP family protein required for cell wall assembly
LTDRPAIPVVTVSGADRKTATTRPTDSPIPRLTHAPTHTASPAATLSPTPTATWASTPSPAPTLHPNPSPVATSELDKDVIHILLIGGDRDYVLDQNTDTLIVVVVNRKTSQVSMLSIPRDLWVNIPTYGWGRINIAQRIGYRSKYPDGKGPGLLMRTIEENLGIPIDHWVRMGYEGFARMVDELGGVEMVVPCRVNLRYKPPTSETEQEMILEAGVHHLDGATALRYVRTRRGGSDFQRAQRQQQFIRAVWDQFKSPDIILKIPGLWSALKGSFGTDLKLGDVLALAPMALELKPHRVRSRYIGNGQVEGWTTPEGWRVLLPVPEKVQQVVASLYAPPVANDQVANEAARIRVQNGNGRPYIARIAADQLRWEGFQIVDIGFADRTDYGRTQIVVFKEKPEAIALLTRLLGVRSKNIIHQPDETAAADLVVILGQDYDPCW